MHWRFDPVFFIRITHDKYVPEGEPNKGEHFRILPTAETVSLLSGLNWLFKPIPNGGFIAAEKSISSDGAMTVLGKLSGPTVFTFLLFAADSSIWLNTPPYDKNSGSLPPFSGRSRVLYFDNLDDTNQPNQTVLSREGKVGMADVASLAPISFRIQAVSAQTRQIDFRKIWPGGGVEQRVQFKPGEHSAVVNLSPGAFRLEFTPSNGVEYLMADDTLLGNNATGIIRIFKDEKIDFNTPETYTLCFSSI